MTTTALLLGLAIQTTAKDKPTLQYYQQTFVIRLSNHVERVPLVEPKPKAPLFVTFRKNDTYAVWDDRGLTVRKKSKVSSSHFEDIAVSPKAFKHDEILKTLDRIQEGQRTKEASGISGARRIGNHAFFLVRWDEKNGKPWSEALVSVDMVAKKPVAQFLGKFEGLSSGTKPIDEKLQIVEGKLGIVSHTKDRWGLATYDPATKEFEFHPLGGNLVSFETLNPTQGLFVETSSYGTTIAGRVDLISGTRKIFYEGREQVRYVDLLDPIVVLGVAGGKTKVVNCTTGLERVLPFVLDARRAGEDILLWTPSSSPKAAWLLSPKTWEPEARWRAQ